MSDKPSNEKQEKSLGCLIIQGITMIFSALISAWVILSIHSSGH